jgi:hypothetical protein
MLAHAASLAEVGTNKGNNHSRKITANPRSCSQDAVLRASPSWDFTGFGAAVAGWGVCINGRFPQGLLVSEPHDLPWTGS